MFLEKEPYSLRPCFSGLQMKALLPVRGLACVPSELHRTVKLDISIDSVLLSVDK
jgi:hypothetical protein